MSRTVMDPRQIGMLDHLPQLHAKPPACTWRPPSEFPTLKGKGIKRICADVETCDVNLMESGPGVRSGGYIAGLALAVDNGPRWYFPIRHEGGGNMDAGMVMGWAREELNAFDGEVVGAQLLYDLDFLAEEGVTFTNTKRFLDIQIAEPLLDENKLKYSVNSLAKEYLGETKREDLLREAAAAYGFGGTERDIKTNLWRLPGYYAGEYGEGDVDLPLRILPLQMARLEAEGLTDVFLELETPLIPLLLAMRRRGVRVDLECAGRIREQLVERRRLMLAELKRLAGPTAEFMQPETFAQALIDRGLPVPMTPKTKKPSIKKKGFLEKYKGKDPLVDVLLEGRGINTIINTFIDGHVLNHHINGRVHCEFNQLKGDSDSGDLKGTIARFSSSNPNMQNLPARDEELAPLVRQMFIPEDGAEWLRHDYSQIEYRLLAHYAVGTGAVECRQKYNEEPDTDYHKLCALLAGMDPDDKFIRKKVKNVNFGKVYGSGIPTIAATMGVSEAEAAEFIRKYDRELPFVKSTFEKAMRRAAERGYVVTLSGRRQRFPMWEPRNNDRNNPLPALPRDQAEKMYGKRITRAFTYAGLNRVSQGGAADIMKKAMVDLNRSGVMQVMDVLVTVHDELDWNKPRTKAGDEAAREAKRIMEQAYTLRVPVIVDMEVGTNWGNAK